MGHYSASKAALKALSDSMRYALDALGHADEGGLHLAAACFPRLGIFAAAIRKRATPEACAVLTHACLAAGWLMYQTAGRVILGPVGHINPHSMHDAAG